MNLPVTVAVAGPCSNLFDRFVMVRLVPEMNARYGGFLARFTSPMSALRISKRSSRRSMSERFDAFLAASATFSFRAFSAGAVAAVWM